MEGVKIWELKVDQFMNSKDEFHQSGEIIPTLEGACRKSYDSQYNSKSQNNNNNNNNGSSPEENPDIV